MKVNNMLDRLYKQFDALSEEYNVFKAETAGDAWLGACNLHEVQPDHAARLARFAVQHVRLCLCAALIATATVPADQRFGVVHLPYA